jgi:hypothetical protein
VLHIVSNEKKLTTLNKLILTNEEYWWDLIIRATWMWGLANTGFTHLDWTLLDAFIDRWHGETSSFHIPDGEITVTLDDRYFAC